jgi:DNA-binding NarL/FixJ family response regulator
MISPYSPIRVIIADDHPFFLEGFVSCISKKAGEKIKIVAVASNGKELVKAAEEHHPDVIITDIKMPEMDGIVASRILTEKYMDDIGIIALTMIEESSIVYEMFESGAKGYLNKNVYYTEAIEAIDAVYNGKIHYCSSSSSALIKMIAPSKYNHYRKASISFSDNEIQIMKLICRQLTSKEIAYQMKISARTVEEYSRLIREKIDAKNLVGIALFAIKNGIVGLNEI